MIVAIVDHERAEFLGDRFFVFRIKQIADPSVVGIPGDYLLQRCHIQLRGSSSA